MDDRLDALRRLPLFARLDDDALERVARVAEVIDVTAGDVLIHEGRYEGYFYVVVAGSAGISRGGFELETVGAGAFFGEVALRDAGPRTATVTALTDCRLIRIQNDDLEVLEATVPAIREALDAAARDRLGRDGPDTARAD